MSPRERRLGRSCSLFRPGELSGVGAMGDGGPDCWVSQLWRVAGLLRALRQWITPPSILPFTPPGSLEPERRQSMEKDVRVGEPAFDEVEGSTGVRRERCKSGVSANAHEPAHLWEEHLFIPYGSGWGPEPVPVTHRLCSRVRPCSSASGERMSASLSRRSFSHFCRHHQTYLTLDTRAHACAQQLRSLQREAAHWPGRREAAAVVNK